MGPAIIKSREIRSEHFNGDRHERRPFLRSHDRIFDTISSQWLLTVIKLMLVPSKTELSNKTRQKQGSISYQKIVLKNFGEESS